MGESIYRINKRNVSSSFIMALTLAAPFATYAMGSEKGDIETPALTLKRKDTEDFFLLPEIYKMWNELSQSPQLDESVKADYRRAMMRLDGRIGDDLFTLPEAYKLLVQSSQNPHLSADMRAEVAFFKTK